MPAGGGGGGVGAVGARLRRGDPGAGRLAHPQGTRPHAHDAPTWTPTASFNSLLSLKVVEIRTSLKKNFATKLGLRLKINLGTFLSSVSSF